MNRILVTGGSGFIGTNLIEALLKQGANEVVNFDLVAPRNARHGSIWAQGDLTSAAEVSSILGQFQPTQIYHLGARTDLHGEAVGDYSANTLGTENMVVAVNEKVPGADVIYASSRLVCPVGYLPKDSFDYNPPNAYGESKVGGERFVRALALHRYVIVRPTSIWGPWFGVPYRDFFDSVRTGQFVRVPVEIPKSFGFVGNTTFQLQRIMAAVDVLASETLYLGDYPPIEINNFAAEIREVLGKAPLREAPLWLLRIAAKSGDLLKRLGWKEPKLTSFRLSNLLTPMVYDLSALERVVGPLPYSQSEGIRATVNWMNGQQAL